MSGLELALRPGDLKQALVHCVSIRDPAFVWGPPGVGKSQILLQLAEELGYVFIDIRMSQMDAIDLRGMPMIPKEHEGKDAVMIWALPEFLPKDPDTKAIIFFDEMNHAIPTNLSAAYQLIQERKLGSYTLPENVVCMAAGNRKGDYGSDFDLPAPLADRFTHLEIKPNVEDWTDWALDNNVHADIIGFIAHKGMEALAQYDQLGKSLTFSTPRSWAKIDDHLVADLPYGIQQALIAGRVGQGLATEFLAYREVTKDLPDPIDVLTGKVKTIENRRTDILYSMATSLCYKLKEFYDAEQAGELMKEDYDKLGDNFLTFISTNFSGSTGILIMAVKTAMSKHKVRLDAQSMPAFSDFIKKHGAVISKYIRKS